MKNSCRLAVGFTLAAAAVAVTAQFAAAQEQRAFPTRPIELIVPFAPGGGSGITGELMKKIVADEKLSPQPLTITYKPGASGQVGWTYLANRKKEGGHSIATATASFNTAFIVGKQLQVTPKDFTPIALMLVDTALIVTHPGSGLKSMKDAIAASRKSPNSVKVGGTGANGADAIVTTMINDAVKIKLNYIPFQSGGEVAAAILGGHVDLAISNPNELFPHIEAGKLVPLAVFSSERLPILKNVPTMKEVGYNITFDSGRGVVAAAGLPKNEEQFLVDLMRKITQTKAWQEYANKNAMLVKFIGGADYAKYLAEERVKLAAILKSMGKN
jgi:putative tricarboxylic transport membrane protein